MEVYKTIFDTWRSQVDSSWQRSSYFAGFEIAAIGGCWLLASSNDNLALGAGVVFSNRRVDSYADLAFQHEEDAGLCGYSGEGEHRFRREAERRSGAKVNSSRSEATLAW